MYIASSIDFALSALVDDPGGQPVEPREGEGDVNIPLFFNYLGRYL